MSLGCIVSGMGEGRSRDPIRVTVETLIAAAENGLSAEGGSPMSPESREVLTRSLARDLGVTTDEAMLTAERIEKIKAQILVLAEVRAESGRTPEETEADRVKGMKILSDALDGQRNRAEDLWNAVTTKRSWVRGRDADRRINAMRYEPERRRL